MAPLPENKGSRVTKSPFRNLIANSDSLSNRSMNVITHLPMSIL